MDKPTSGPEQDKPCQPISATVPIRDYRVTWLSCTSMTSHENYSFDALPSGLYVRQDGLLIDHYYGPFHSWMSAAAGAMGRVTAGVLENELSTICKESKR